MRVAAAATALALVAAGCGDEAPDEVVTAVPAATAGPAPTPEPSPLTTTVGDVDDVGDTEFEAYQEYEELIAQTGPLPPDGGELVDCADVPELEATVEGTLGGTQNPPQGVTEPLIQYGMQHPDTFGGLWIDRAHSGTLVLTFTDDLEPHREALLALVGDSDAIVDVLQVRFTEVELRATQNAIGQYMGADYGLLSTSVATTKNRIELGFVDPPDGAIEALTTLLPTTAVCVSVTRTPEPPTGPLDVVPDLTTEDPLVSCGGARVRYSTLLDPPAVEDIDHPAVDALLRELETPGFEPLPSGDWVVLAIDDGRAAFAVLEEGEITGFARFGQQGDAWVLDGWGAGGRCDALALPDGLGVVETRLDAAALPEPDDTAINLLVTERGCASGREMGDALLGPQVIETDEAVLIAFAVIPVAGPAECPGNPSTPVTIELAAPLGDRLLLDGLSVPPQPLTDEES